MTPEEVGDPVKHVICLNEDRRHLSQSQLAMVASNIANLKEHSNQHKVNVVLQDCRTIDPKPISVKEAAAIVGVSERMVNARACHVEAEEKPKAEERKKATQAKPGEKVGEGAGNFPSPNAGRTKDIAAEALGRDRRTIEHSAHESTAILPQRVKRDLVRFYVW